MWRCPARIGGFLATTNGGENLDFLRDLLERSLLGQTGNGFQDSLLVRQGISLKCRNHFASTIITFIYTARGLLGLWHEFF